MPRNMRESPTQSAPIVTNPTVDPSAIETDVKNSNYVPNSKVEFEVAVRQLVKDRPVSSLPRIYRLFCELLAADDEKAKREDDMKKHSGSKSIEEAVREAVRAALVEAAPLPTVKKIPFGVHGPEYMRRIMKTKSDLQNTMKTMRTDADDSDDDVEIELTDDDAGDIEVSAQPTQPTTKAYKSTAIGGMEDVGGTSFAEIAKELGFSVSGAKRAVDMALDKARWLATGIDGDELEILVLSTMNKYIDVLNKTGELSSADVQLMKSHPDIVRELDGFREFLDTEIKKARKANPQSAPQLEERHQRLVRKALRLTGVK